MKARRGVAIAGIAVLGACAGVLGLRATRSERPFAHGSHVRAGVTCLTCHTPASIAGDRDPVALPQPSQCIGCHTKPHDERPCMACHGESTIASAAVEARDHLTFSHATHVPRLNGNCARCHTDIATSDGPLRPKMATCIRCHEHDDQFDPDRCDTCHVDLETERTLPETHVVHDGDWIREHGVRAAAEPAMCSTCHTQRACAECHGVTAPSIPAKIRFDIPDESMLHRAGFRARHAEEARADPGTCSSCHAESACRDCHDRNGVGAATAAGFSPHPPGWVGLASSDNEHGRAARRDPASCASCHGGAGEQLCVGCHRVGGVGGSPHPPGWSSRQPMSALPCRLCHQ